jgi:hypothetical protein
MGATVMVTAKVSTTIIPCGAVAFLLSRINRRAFGAVLIFKDALKLQRQLNQPRAAAPPRPAFSPDTYHSRLPLKNNQIETRRLIVADHR